jgi:predicted branched-subunit amino acid permease
MIIILAILAAEVVGLKSVASPRQKKYLENNQAWWYIPITSATWEVESWRTVVGGHLGKMLAKPHLNQ